MKIVFYCGNSLESWSPKSESTGVGGSEEAVINMSRELAKLGNEVIVYNRCEDNEGEYDGVTYENYEYYDNPETDILIYWRVPEYIEKFKRGNAKQVYLWLHDVTPEYEVLPIKLLVDGIFCLSKYHASFLPHLKDKIIITQNGINLEQFNQKVWRKPKRIVYGSSYDRGLKELLEMWQEIKLAEPEAELRVFYGWDNMDKAIENGNQEMKEFKEYIEELFKQQGVTHLGRINHKEVAKEYLSAGVWAYPSWFPEISCITAMKAQAGGAIPVVTPTGALQETVKWGLTTREPRDDRGQIPWGSKMPPYLMNYYTDLILKALDNDFQSKFREQMMKEAKRIFSWEVVAYIWNDLFTKETK